MPLLVIALMTHVVYRLMTNGWEWTTDASGRAWSASMDKSAALADRIRQRMLDKLDEWEKDPRARGYAAWSVKAAGKTARGFGKGALWSVLAATRAAGAVTRAVTGGAVATGGLLGALAQGVRDGAAAGADWWTGKYGEDASDRARRWAGKAGDWGRTFPGETGEPIFEEPIIHDEKPPPNQPRDNAGPTGDTDGRPWERPPFQAGEATVGTPPSADTVLQPTEILPPGGGHTSTVQPTPVSSSTAGTPAGVGAATAVLDHAPATTVEGDSMTTLVPTTASSAAVFPAGADGLQYERAQAFLAQQAQRAQLLADQVEQLVALMHQIQAAAALMQNDHTNAEAGLARFNVVAPNVGEAIGMLQSIVQVPAEDVMVLMYQQLGFISTGCIADADDLASRFGAAWESTRAENIDGSFYNG